MTDSTYDDLASGISVDRYLLGLDNAHTDERLRVALKVEADFKAGKKANANHTIRTRVVTNSGVEEREFSSFSWHDAHDPLWLLLRYPYAGKGSPEGIQVLLQLASMDGPGAPPIVTPEKFQAYCDKWLGLDCNGFVGNYLRHEYQAIPWWDTEITTGSVAPDSLITSIWDLAPGLERRLASGIDGNDLNLMVMVDAAGRIIPGGTGGFGHILISDPGDFSRADDLAARMGLAANTAVPAVSVFESTAAVDSADGKSGLAQSFYAYVDQPKQPGVMHVHRGLNNSFFNVRVKGLPWPI